VALNDQQKRVLRDAGSASRSAMQLLLSVLVAPLPSAWRKGWNDRFGPVPDSVGMLSSFLQLAAFFSLGFLGFFWYLKATMAQATTMESSAMLWLNPLHPFIYMLTTPYGFLAGIGTFGGLIRTLAAAGSRQNVGDPTLGLIEIIRCAILDRKAAGARQRSKGARSRDLIEHAQADEAWDLRIVSCDEYDWHPGAGVQALGSSWTLLASRDVTDEQGRLRVVYELRKPSGAEAVRGYNAYQPQEPPRVIGEARERDTAPQVDERAAIPLAPPDPERAR
jgi:hypothetical protein